MIILHITVLNDIVHVLYHLPDAAEYQRIQVSVNDQNRLNVYPEETGNIVLRGKPGEKMTIRLQAISWNGAKRSEQATQTIFLPIGITGKRADGFTIQPPAQRKRGFASIGLYNPKTAENVGGVIRAAHAYGAASVAISGQRIDGRHIAALTNTTRAERHLPVYRGELRDLIPFGAVPVAVELVDGAVSLFDFQHPRSAFYIFGPEDSGLGPSVRDWCKYTVQIPTAICMNLAATVNVVLYDRACKEAT